MSVPSYKRHTPKIEYLSLAQNLHTEVAKVIMYTMNTQIYFLYTQTLGNINMTMLVNAHRISVLRSRGEYGPRYANTIAKFADAVGVISIVLNTIRTTLDDPECVKLYNLETKNRERAIRHLENSAEHIYKLSKTDIIKSR